MNLSLDEKGIENIAGSEEVWKKGEILFRGGKVFSQQIQAKAIGGFFLSAAVSDGGQKSVKVSFDSGGNLVGYICGCGQKNIWKGCCPHVVATLLSIRKTKGDYLERSRIQSASGQFLKEVEEELLGRINQEASLAMDVGRIRLVPWVLVRNGRMSLKFSIGKERLYVLKNIREFLDNIEDGADVAYGKDLAFTHSFAAFDKDSAALIRFIKSCFALYDKTAGYGNFGNDFSDGRQLDIYEQSIDDFFELYLGKTLQVSLDGKKYEELLFKEGNPDINFSLKEEEEGSFALVYDGGDIAGLKGGNYSYMIATGGFYRAKDEFYRMSSRVFDAMETAGGKKLIFAEGDVHKYLTWLHPKLRRLNLLRPDADVYLPSVHELVKKVYVDFTDGIIRLKTEFCYGEESYNTFSTEPDAARDVAEEYRLLCRLRQMGFVPSGEGFYELADDEQIYDFYYYGLEGLKNCAEIYVSESFGRMAVPAGGQASFGLRLSGGLLELQINTEDYDREELLQIMNATRARKKFYKLRDGRFVNLAEPGVASAAQLISGLNLSDDEILGGEARIPAYRAFYIDEVRKSNEGVIFERDKAFKKLTRDFRNYKELDFEPPDEFNGVLRDYQKEGLNWLRFLDYYGFGGILADDMGLGKTIQIITLLLACKHEEERRPSLVIAPTSLIYNWESEIRRFAPNISTCLVSGPPSRRKELLDGFMNGETDVYITTYDTLKRDSEHYAGRVFRYIIADEAQYIKNPGTRNAKALKSLKGQGKFALTGTPIENSLSELWSIFDFIMPGYLYSYADFSEHYEAPIVKNEDGDAAEELKRQLRPFILRRMKKDVLKELPDKTETVLRADMTEEQRKLYMACLLEARGELYSNENNQIALLAMITRLRQICCHPSLFAENYDGGSGKLELAIETVETALSSGHRILLFSQFTSMLAIIRARFEKARIGYFYLDGATPSKERLDLAERFNRGENGAFLISLKAGGTGLNLTGADVIIHYDPWWNPAVMEQASDRAHRLGQENKVQVYSLVAKDSIEERIMLLQEKKRALTETVLDGGTASFGKLSREEIAGLIGGMNA